MTSRSVRLFLLMAVFLAAGAARAQEVLPIAVSVPGPRNLSYLPIDLIGKIGADKQAGVALKLLYTGGGAVALNNLVTRNADFAVAGMPAAMSLRANGGDVVAVASVDDSPLFVLMVRNEMRGKIKRITDLKGKVLGVNTSTKASKTTSQQLLELLLKSNGVSPDEVRIVPAGQSWEEQSSLLLSGAADAVMGDEPYASRLRAAGKVFFLAHLGEQDTVKSVPGADFLHAAVVTRSDIIAKEPAKVAKMVAMLRATLNWMAAHSPEEIVGKLGLTDPLEREAFVFSLRNSPRAFSRDGRFSTAQLQHTEVFFRATDERNPLTQALRIEPMVNDRWAGRRP